MNATHRTAAKGGLVIGVINLVWLYLAYFLSLHTSGIMVFQVFMLVWFIITTVGFVLTLQAVRRQSPSLSYWRGIWAGAVAAVVSAVVAVAAQVGYFTVVHPGWPEVMAEQTRIHFATQGMLPEQVEQRVMQARRSFTLSNYAAASAVTALTVGFALSAIIMIFLRRQAAVSHSTNQSQIKR